MDHSKHVAPRGARDISPSNADPHPTLVLPFGQNGAGLLTGHPIGLVIVLGLLLLGMVGMPEARWFFAGSLGLGSAFGLVLWLHHR